MNIVLQKWRRSDTILLVITLILTWMAFAQHSGSEQPSDAIRLPRVGYQAPSFELMTLEGQSIRLEDLRGKSVFLNFWASWCPPCNDEMPDMVQLSQKYRDDVAFVGINLTSGDRMEKVRAFVDQYEVAFPTLLDTDETVRQRYQVFAVPTTLMIDPNGKVIERRDGPMSAKLMEEFIQAAMEVNAR